MAHRRTFRTLRRVDAGLLWLNLLMLGFVALLPFPTEVLGKYADTTIATILYAVAIAAVGIVSVTLYWHVQHANLAAPVSAESARLALARASSGQPCSSSRCRLRSRLPTPRSTSGSRSGPRARSSNAGTPRASTEPPDPARQRASSTTSRIAFDHDSGILDRDPVAAVRLRDVLRVEQLRELILGCEPRRPCRTRIAERQVPRLVGGEDDRGNVREPRRSADRRDGRLVVGCFVSLGGRRRDELHPRRPLLGCQRRP